MGTIKRTLNKSVLSAVVFFTLLLSACLGIIGYRTYYSGVIQQYQKYERDVLSLAINDLDWDSIEECINKGEEDDAFGKLRERLDYIKTNTNIDWLYMVEPLNTEENDNMKYICTGNTPENYAEVNTRLMSRESTWIFSRTLSPVSSGITPTKLNGAMPTQPLL